MEKRTLNVFEVPVERRGLAEVMLSQSDSYSYGYDGKS
ncbi:MAG: hypothetical protein QOH63_440 [Acidobacteriota bacterium]|jgi:hypothetical protein|nr:hypothetical protein [Acidobacteriota bacterium]